MALFKPSMGPLVSRCAKKVSRLGRWFLHRRATFFTGFNRHRIAQPYHLSKYRPAGFTVGHDQKVRKRSLIAQARVVCKLSRLSFSKPSACLIGTFFLPIQPEGSRVLELLVTLCHQSPMLILAHLV